MSTNNNRRQVTLSPRFFVFVTIFLSLLAWMIYGITQLLAPAKIEWGELDSSFRADAIIVRNETVVTSSNNGRLECLIAEGEKVSAGTSVAELNLSDYSEEDVKQLNSIQQEIKDYQNSNILKNIVNADLEEIDDSIDTLIDEISELAMTNRSREIPIKDNELKVLMEQRRRYMNENLATDATLDKLFQQEQALTEKMNDDIVTMNATSDGIVSFFLDGMETVLTYAFLTNMSSNDYDMARDQIENTYDSISFGEDSYVVTNQPVYRIVDPYNWYVMMKIPRNKDTLKTGESYMVNFEGYDLGYVNGTVAFKVDSGRDAILVMHFQQDISTMSTLRMVTCNFGDSNQGFKVPRDYIQYIDGVYGITYRDDGKVFAPVNILAQDNTHVIIEAANPNIPLSVGKRLVKEY